MVRWVEITLIKTKQAPTKKQSQFLSFSIIFVHQTFMFRTLKSSFKIWKTHKVTKSVHNEWCQNVSLNCQHWAITTNLCAKTKMKNTFQTLLCKLIGTLIISKTKMNADKLQSRHSEFLLLICVDVGKYGASEQGQTIKEKLSLFQKIQILQNATKDTCTHEIPTLH